MTNQVNADKPVIVFVDHEEKSLEEVIGSIGKPKRTRSTMEKVGESCVMLGAFVEAMPRDTLFDRAVAKVNEVSSTRDLILVDLSFDDESRESKSIVYGRELALKLKEHFKGVAVGVYSKYDLSPRDRAYISSDGFSLMLEEIRKMYDGARSLPGDLWYDLFQITIAKARKAYERDTPPHGLTDSDGTVRWADGHPVHRSRGFMEAAPNLAASALRWLPDKPSEIIISELGGGFSGAYVIKAVLPGRPTSFVIKIDEDPEKLERELKGYQIIQSRVEHRYYLPLVGMGVKWPVTLYSDWWGAFAMSYEGSAKPLLEHLANPDGEPLSEIYRRLWDRCLFSLYGSASKREVELRNIVPDTAWDTAREGGKALERYKPRVNEFNDSTRDAFGRAASLVVDPLRPPVYDRDTINVDWVEQIHGDLNCRNILYAGDDRSFSIIDFPNVSPNGLAIDFVKAEAELVLIMLDWSTGRDCDFMQIDAWAELTGYISAGFSPTSRDWNVPEIERVFSAIAVIREIFSSRAQNSTESKEAYRLYLLSRVLRYVGYSDITIAKRFLALIWAGQLSGGKW